MADQSSNVLPIYFLVSHLFCKGQILFLLLLVVSHPGGLLTTTILVSAQYLLAFSCPPVPPYIQFCTLYLCWWCPSVWCMHVRMYMYVYVYVLTYVCVYVQELMEEKEKLRQETVKKKRLEDFKKKRE